MAKSSMVYAGIDTGKYKLDAALAGGAGRLQVDNAAAGHAALAAWLAAERVTRVGIEATGGYERAVVAALRGAGFEVAVLQPAQVRAYARFRLQRAKNDRIDAALIAAATAELGHVHAPPDPRLAPLAEQLTLIEQLTEDVARLKTRRVSPHGDPQIAAFWSAEITRLRALLRARAAALVAAIRRHADLAQRLDLIGSVAGVGLKTALAILLRMPEIGAVTREQAAALAGLAPYEQDSGEHKSDRHIEGGRTRLRKASMPPRSPPPSAGTPPSAPSTAASSPREKPTRRRSSPAPASCSCRSTPSSPAAPRGQKSRGRCHPEPSLGSTASGRLFVPTWVPP